MSAKVRLNQYSQFEIECFVNGVQTWRQAFRGFLPDGEPRFVPDFDDERETCMEDKDGEFHIIQND